MSKSANRVKSSDELWKDDGDYYRDVAVMLRSQAALPDLKRVRDRRLFSLFQRHANVGAGSRVAEIGCGGSAWLPFLGLRMGCKVSGIEIEPFAADLARANLMRAGVKGDIFCRDAFDRNANADLIERFDLVFSRGVIEHFDNPTEHLRTLASYLKPGGRILTTVPNLQGINQILQRFVDVNRFEMHVVYDHAGLARVHADAGLRALANGYVGYYDGWLTAPTAATSSFKRGLHRRLCWLLSAGAEVLARSGSGPLTPELRWTSPHVYCVASRR